VRDVTITPQFPLRVRAVSPPSVDARSAAVLGLLYRTTGIAGGLLRLGLRTRRLVVVCFFLVCWASRIGGVTAHAATAISMAIRILRENIINR
jgi:hypothetical protein